MCSDLSSFSDQYESRKSQPGVLREIVQYFKFVILLDFKHTAFKWLFQCPCEKACFFFVIHNMFSVNILFKNYFLFPEIQDTH